MITFHHVCSICGCVYGLTVNGSFLSCEPWHAEKNDALLFDSKPSHGYCTQSCADKHILQLLAHSVSAHHQNGVSRPTIAHPQHFS